MKEVHRAAKVGEYIKLTVAGYTFNKLGDILKVSEVGPSDGLGLVRVAVKDHPHYPASISRQSGTWSYLMCEYVVLEDYEEEKDMSFTKKDLRTGDIVITRNGWKYMIMLNGSDGRKKWDYLCNMKRDSKEDFDRYCDNMKHKYNNDWDIMEVYRPGCFNRPWEYDIDCATPIYTREEVKEMTVEEISKALGYEVKVIKG